MVIFHVNEGNAGILKKKKTFKCASCVKYETPLLSNEVGISMQ